LEGKQIIHYTASDLQKRANSAVLIGGFAIVYLGRSPDLAYRPLAAMNPPFISFRFDF
jgi:cell division cycle 14